MKRISTILAIAAVVTTGFVSSASAQSFSAGWGTGNVSSSYYGTDGRLHAGNSNVQPNQVAADRNGLNAFAAAPQVSKTHSRAQHVMGKHNAVRAHRGIDANAYAPADTPVGQVLDFGIGGPASGGAL